MLALPPHRVAIHLLMLILGLALAHPTHAQATPDAALLAEGEKAQVIQFNPSAALQQRVFADGFVPNSAEFGLEVAGVAYAAQRAENLTTGLVRVYHVVVGDWSNVRFVQRGAGGDALAEALLAEGQQKQVIQFNPNAALQKRIFAEGFVPNSPEFGATVNGVAYSAQRAENLANGQVRVYHVVIGDWTNVRTAARGVTQAAIAPPVIPPPQAPPPMPTASVNSSGPSRGVPRASISTCPTDYPIKGNQGVNGWIYHVPSGEFYTRTNPEECFATEADARAAGYRRSQQ